MRASVKIAAVFGAADPGAGGSRRENAGRNHPHHDLEPGDQDSPITFGAGGDQWLISGFGALDQHIKTNLGRSLTGLNFDQFVVNGGLVTLIGPGCRPRPGAGFGVDQPVVGIN